MKRIITFLMLAAMAVPLMAQFANDQANLEKYWIYRQRLKENFLFLSNNNEHGSNIPVSRIKPNVVQTSPGVFDIRHVEYVDWDDSNGALPYYIMLLATEYKLLKQYANPYNNNNTIAAQTLNELWNAISALERLDIFADGSVNGVFRRSDICYLMNRSNSTQPAYIPLVGYFDNLNAGDELIKFKFREEILIGDDDPIDNVTKARYNSVDNIIKFIEAESVVRALLSDDANAYSARSKLNLLVRKMLENAYHPNEPRSFWDRDVIATQSEAFMRRTWYLKDADRLNIYPNGLLNKENGGAGDGLTYATSYGLAKSSKKLGLNYEGTDNSYLLFPFMMNVPMGYYGQVNYTKILYNNCSPNYELKFIDVSGNNNPLTLGMPSYWFCSEVSRETNSEGINSDWMIRTLAAVNDIRPGIQSTYRYLTHLRENRSKPLEHLPMIWNVIYKSKSQITDSDRAYVGSLLNISPRCGPSNIQLAEGNFQYAVHEWSSPNRFVWSELCGSQDTWRHGYYNGIDYMVLHNLYWLTKVDASESSTVYKDQVIENQQKSIVSKSEHVYARYSVKLKPGFKVTGNSNYCYVAGTNPNIRTGYDNYMPYTKLAVDFCSECDPIFNANPLKSISITMEETSGLPDTTIVSIFPNPANNLIMVSSNEAIQRIALYNSTGKIVFNIDEIITEAYTFDISSLSPGIYIVKTLLNNGYEKIAKVLKKEL